MVMHARKIPRISDGFSEKHQTHGYEKYGKSYRYGGQEKRDSPSTNSLRSSSPNSHSQSPRYHKNYYKIRENRDRGRDRERDYKDFRDRDNSRSPKERRRDIRDRDHRDHKESRGICERINSVHKKDEKERLLRVGDWSEHVSSSGKKYYYNCRSEVSQWEKPPEWLDWERNHRTSMGLMGNHRSSSSALGHSGTPANHGLCKENSHHAVQRGNNHGRNRPERHSSLNDAYRDMRDMERDRRSDPHNDSNFDHRRDHRKYNQEVGCADMEISSGDSSPSCESVPNKTGTDVGDLSASSKFSRGGQKSGGGSVCPPSASSASSLPGAALAASSNSNSSSSTPANSSSQYPNLISSAASAMLSAMPQLLNSHPRLSALTAAAASSNFAGPILPSAASLSHQHHHLHQHHLDAANSAAADPHLILGANNHQLAAAKSQSDQHFHHQQHQNLSQSAANSNNVVVVGPGSLTPTHSEIQEGYDARKQQVGSPKSSLNSLQSLSQQQPANSLELTPSLGNYYKEPLISHVQSWPAENIERQCHRMSEETHTISSLIMTKVSADLKMARSLVRLAEIQATLHEQRILFLKAQKRELEELQSKNCFMNES